MNHLKEGRTFFGGVWGFKNVINWPNPTFRSVFMKQLIQHVTTTYNFITFWAHKENEDVLVYASLTFNLGPEAGSGQDNKVFQQKNTSTKGHF